MWKNRIEINVVLLNAILTTYYNCTGFVFVVDAITILILITIMLFQKKNMKKAELKTKKKKIRNKKFVRCEMTCIHLWCSSNGCQQCCCYLYFEFKLYYLFLIFFLSIFRYSSLPFFFLLWIMKWIMGSTSELTENMSSLIRIEIVNGAKNWWR